LPAVPPNADLRTKLIANTEKYYNGLSKLRLQYQVNIVTELLNPKNNQNPNRLTKIEYCGQFPYFDIKIKHENGDVNENPLTKEVAYDGKYVQYLSGTGRLDLTTVKPKFDDSCLCLLGTRNPGLFAPFWFINPEVIRNLYYIDHAWNLKKLIASNKSFANFTILGRQVADGTSCIVIALQIGDPWVNSNNPDLPTFPDFPNDVEVKAYLNEKLGYYPMRWELVSKSRGVLVEYQIKELGTFTDNAGEIYYYPAKGVMTDWGSMNPANFTKPHAWTAEIKSVSALLSKSDISDFTIDPGLATLIFEDDKNRN
jgi:hypothetical protein